MKSPSQRFRDEKAKQKMTRFHHAANTSEDPVCVRCSRCGCTESANEPGDRGPCTCRADTRGSHKRRERERPPNKPRANVPSGSLIKTAQKILQGPPTLIKKIDCLKVSERSACLLGKSKQVQRRCPQNRGLRHQNSPPLTRARLWSVR